MKVFKFEKNENDIKYNKTRPVILSDKQMFNHIIINNPINSNCLCIINSIIFKLGNNKNEMIFSCYDDNELIKNKVKLGCLNIDYGSNKYGASENIELNKKEIFSNIDVDLLEEEFLIILPGGSLCIKLKEPVKNLELSISIGEEVI